MSCGMSPGRQGNQDMSESGNTDVRPKSLSGWKAVKFWIWMEASAFERFKAVASTVRGRRQGTWVLGRRT